MKKKVITAIIYVITLINTYAQVLDCNFTLNTGNNNQTICLDSPVNDITYNTQDNSTVKGLPPGVTSKFFNINCCCAPCPTSHLDIIDTARASGVYTYTLVGSYCNNSTTVTGTINVSTTGSCYRNCFANFITTYDTLQNQFTLLVDQAVSATSFNWNFGDGTTSTLVQPTHAFSTDTTYNVCLTATTAANNTCTYCHTIGKNYKGNILRTQGFSLKVLNTQNVASEIASETSVNTNFIVYPNPTNGQSAIKFNRLVSKVAINIYNSVGQKIIENLDFSGMIYSINLTNQPSGLYTVEVIQEEKNVSKVKIIVR